MAATGLHQLTDKLDAAGALGVGERDDAVELQLLLLKGFPESGQLSCYGSDIIHYSGRPVVIIVFVLDSNGGRTQFQTQLIIYIVIGHPALSSVKVEAN
jgi:hypothetical protein